MPPPAAAAPPPTTTWSTAPSATSEAPSREPKASTATERRWHKVAGKRPGRVVIPPLQLLRGALALSLEMPAVAMRVRPKAQPAEFEPTASWRRARHVIA